MRWHYKLVNRVDFYVPTDFQRIKRTIIKNALPNGVGILIKF